MVITSTPLRISYSGGGTDFPVWYLDCGCAVLATTINKSCYITCLRMPPFFEYHSRISYSRIENVGRNDVIEHTSIRRCLQYLDINDCWSSERLFFGDGFQGLNGLNDGDQF